MQGSIQKPFGDDFAKGPQPAAKVLVRAAFYFV